MRWITPMLQRFLGPGDALLDLGCGNGGAIDSLKCKRIVGMDVWDYKDVYPHNFIRKDVTKLDNIKSNLYDVVFVLDVIEHLEKWDGYKLLEDAERIARKRVFFLTPKKWDENKSAVENPIYWSYGNKHNYHVSLWSIDEFESRGYTIIQDPNYIFAIKNVN